MKQLTHAGITLDLKERTDMVLYYLQNTGEFDAAVQEWEVKPAVKKSWANIKTFMLVEYAKENKQIRLTAKQLRENAIKEQAEATEELISNPTKAHTHQTKNLIIYTTKRMKEMLSLFKANANKPANPTNPMNY